MKKRFKLTGFTLTELLVVVIVIGVLSAAVLPKFNKVIETRKTTEAEELMASIRTEQEKRCALDKNYLTDLSNLTDIVKKNDTKNYSLALKEGGILASSKGNYSYKLQMPSYADGRICCDGDDCEKLNKNYPTCDELKNKSDYEPAPESCVGQSEPPVVCNDCTCAEYAAANPSICNPKPEPACDDSHKEGETYTKACTCGQAKGKWHCGADTGYAWKQQETVSCAVKPSNLKRDCEDGTGTQTTSFVCENGVWKQQEWSECVPNKTCDQPDTNNGCASGVKWGDCSHFDGNGGWCYQFIWDAKSCEWKKQGAGGPPTYCTAAKTAMSPYYCECTESNTKPKYVWKQAWSQKLLRDTNGSLSGHSIMAAVNTTLLGCKGVTPHSWDELRTCGSGVTLGGECQLGDSCVKYGSAQGSLALRYCEFGGGNDRTGNNVNIPCDESANDSFVYAVNQACGGSVYATQNATWRDERYMLPQNATWYQATGYACGQE